MLQPPLRPPTNAFNTQHYPGGHTHTHALTFNTFPNTFCASTYKAKMQININSNERQPTRQSMIF